MMKFEITRNIGPDIVKIDAEATDIQDFFKQMCLLQAIPNAGPNGEPDVYLSYRQAKKEFDYYSVVCESAGMEFKFGVPKANNKTLFPKGWHPIKHKLNRYEPQEEFTGDPDESTRTDTRPQTPAPAQANNSRSVLRSVPAAPTLNDAETLDQLTGVAARLNEMLTGLRRVLPRIGINNTGQEKAWVMKTLGQRAGKSVDQCNLAELNMLWQAANNNTGANAA